MTSIATLPLELTLDIIGYLRPELPCINRHEGPVSKPDILRLLEERPFIFDENLDDSHRDAKEGQVRRPRGASHRPQYLDLSALSRTSRYFYNLCNPFIHVELDIVPHRAAMSDALVVTSRYGDYVRHLRIAVTYAPPESPDGERYEQLILDSLEACRYVTSLSVYFHGWRPPTAEQFTKKFNNQVMLLFKKRIISSLGVYSFTVANGGFLYGAVSRGLQSLLGCLVPLFNDTPSLEHVEIAESIDQDTYDVLRNAVFLHSVTFRACLTHELEKIWSPESAHKWAFNFNLTHLRLINCQSAYPPHIPEIVKHFSSLSYLLVSACGDHSDIEPPAREAGWSGSSDALWLQRAPLDTFHIEHMIEWEVLAMGTIPAKTVIATSMWPGELKGCFILDPEIFPRLELLKVEHTVGDWYEEPVGAPAVEVREADRLRAVLSSREGIVVTEDAYGLFNRR